MDWKTLIFIFMFAPRPAYGASASALDEFTGPFRVGCAKEVTITVAGLTALSGTAPLEISTRETTFLKAASVTGWVSLSDQRHLAMCPTASGPSFETVWTPMSSEL